MQAPSPISLSAGQIVIYLAMALGGGVIGLLINRLFDWGSGRTKAEIVEIRTRAVKMEVEAHVSTAQMLIDATKQIVDLADVNQDLQNQLTEAERERDNCEFNLHREQAAHEQLKIASGLREHFIEQLQAANKLGVQLKDLPMAKTGEDESVN